VKYRNPNLFRRIPEQDSFLLRWMLKTCLNRSTSHQRTFFSSTPRHVVDAARTAAQWASIQLGLEVATWKRCFFYSTGRALPISL
jgi:hypothetical protein